MLDGRRLLVCQAVSRDTVKKVLSEKKTPTSMKDSRNLHLIRESCTSACSAFISYTVTV